MNEAVVLEYRRVGELSTGRVYLHTLEGEQSENSFEDLEFPKMLRLFAEKLVQYKDATAVWQRVDYPGLIPYSLEDTVVRLFREDPVAAISSMCPPSRSPSSTMQRALEERVGVVPVSIRVGHDSLADCFGDLVFARTRMRAILHVECPCCGIWAPVIFTDANNTNGESSCKNPRCRAAELYLPLVVTCGRWAGYNPLDLIMTGSQRFYLPRAWNDDRSWVTWEELQQKYDAYKKEKEKWSQAACPRG